MSNRCFRAIILFFILLPGFSLFSQEYNVYESELIITLPVGSENIEAIGISSTTTVGWLDGPRAFTLTPSGNFVIGDYINERLAWYGSQGNFIKQRNFDAFRSESIYMNELNTIEYSRGRWDYHRFSEDREADIYVVISNPQNSDGILGPPFYLEGAVFAYQDGNSIIAIDNPTNDFEENKLHILDEEETRALIQSPRFQNAGITITSDNRILKNGILISRNFPAYIDYWMNSHDLNDIQPPNSMKEVSFELTEIGDLNYLGMDSSYNSYWSSANYLLVFSSHGWLVEYIRFSNIPHKVLPSVHPNGDVYFLDYDEEGVYIYRIPNTWAPFDWQPPSEDVFTNSTATVTANGLRMRDNPATTSSNVVASLDQGTTVEILGQSAAEETIGGNTNFWYRVRTSDGLDGWLFGAFLDLNP